MSRCGRSGRVFGLQVTSSFPLAGLDDASDGPPDVELVLDAPWWDPSEAEVLSDARFADGRPALRVEASPDGAFRFWGHGYGEAVALADGARVACAPTDPAVFPRLLHGQVLPFLSGRRGFEVLHACAVLVDGAAVLVCGPSGSGKSTTLRALLARGTGFLADDAVALDAELRAWAGPGVIGPGLEPATAAAPSAAVRAVVLLERGPGDVAVGPSSDPFALLRQGYDALPREPERQAASLDRLSALAATSETLVLRVPDGATARAADALLAALAR